MPNLLAMKKPRLLDLNDAIQHPGRHVVFDISTDLEEEEDLDLIKPVTGQLDAVSTGNILLVSGAFHAFAVMECSRCLTAVQVEFDFSVSEEFPVTGTPAGFGGREHAEVAEEDEPYPLFDGNQLRYEDLLRQAFWLNVPMRVLCDEACTGLADGDGADKGGRPELEALAELLEEEEQS